MNMRESIFNFFFSQRRWVSEGHLVPAPGGGPVWVGIILPRVSAAHSAANVQVGSHIAQKDVETFRKPMGKESPASLSVN